MNKDQVTTVNNDSDKTVNPVTLQFKRAFKDVADVFSCMKRLVEENRDRDKKSGAVMKRYNDEPIWNQAALKANAQGWRRNVSTGFLSSMVKRVVVPFKQIVNKARVLTSSKLRSNTIDGDAKSLVFQQTITKYVRRWRDWKSFIARLVLEDVLFGYGAVIWTDEFEWRPKVGRNDEAHFPEGNPESESGTPLFTFYQPFMIHELAEKLKDAETSRDAGWNIKNLVESINNAMPEDRRSRIDSERAIEDTYRESSVGLSYSKGVKVVEAKHMFVVEPETNRVSHFILDNKTGKELFIKLDRFASMEDCLRLFTVEEGNGKLHGSKGLGRLIYNTALSTEQARNLIHDALYLAGLVWVKANTKSKERVALKVTHPVVVVDEGFDVIDKGKIEMDVEAFFALDRHMVQIAELQSGQFVAGQILDQDGEKRTASEVNYTASIEQQIREGVLERFWGQFQGVAYNIQRRICSPDNISEAISIHKKRSEGIVKQMTRKMFEFTQSVLKKVFQPGEVQIEEESPYLDMDAVECIVEMLTKGLSAEEIFELANTPTNEESDAVEDAQAISSVVATYTGDPSIRQNKLKRMDLATKLGHEKADELLIPEEDNTVQVEAETKQVTEIFLMANGQDVGVSPRDEDMVHLQTIVDRSQPIISSFSGGGTEETIDILKRIGTHAEGHIQSALGKGIKKEELAPFVDFAEELKATIGQTKMLALPQMPQNQQLPPNASGDEVIDPAALPSDQPIPPYVDMPLANAPQDLTPRVN
jgi:hypothetical protein